MFACPISQRFALMDVVILFLLHLNFLYVFLKDKKQFMAYCLLKLISISYYQEKNNWKILNTQNLTLYSMFITKANNRNGNSIRNLVADIMMHISNNNTKNYPLYRLQLMVETFGHLT